MTTAATPPYTGGCQCGAIRFRVESLGRPSICHCRMCQKATGGIAGIYVIGHGITWTRGELKHYRSSNQAQRGFCGDCGTPLTFEDSHGIDLSVAAFDRAGEIAPDIQHSYETRLPWFDTLLSVHQQSPEERASAAPHTDGIVSYQHPDHDTDAWPLPGTAAR